jgi:cell division protein FtsN
VFGKAPRGVTPRPATPEVNQPIVPSWLWLVFGTLLGLSLAVLLYLWQPWQPAERVQPTIATETAAASQAQQPKPSDEDFQFYDLLPKQQVTAVPEEAVPAQPTTAAEPLPDAVATPDVGTAVLTPSADGATPDPAGMTTERQPMYLLQINSFTNADEADRQRAEVLLVGLSADVRQTTTRDGTLWYRVVSGPFNSKTEAMDAQRSLQDSGIDALVVEQP